MIPVSSYFAPIEGALIELGNDGFFSNAFLIANSLVSHAENVLQPRDIEFARFQEKNRQVSLFHQLVRS